MCKIKNIKKLLLVSLVSLALFSSVLIPITNAQEWTYNGADTERIPHFSVYPSEWYIYEFQILDEKFHRGYEIAHGNVSDVGWGDGICVWATSYNLNVGTHDILNLRDALFNWSFWIDSGDHYGGWAIPVEDDGRVSEDMFNNVSLFYESFYSYYYNFEYNQSNFDYLSMEFWNETYNNYYFKYNFSTDGVLTYSEIYYPPIPFPNVTLYSRPMQLPPEFSFTTEHDTLTVDSTDMKLNISITDADNNNNGVIDTDYLYRVKNGTTWTDWASIPTLIDYDLGSVGTGSYNITLEVKNMYGVTQEEIIIQYTPGDQDAIPGFHTLLVALMLTLCMLITLSRYRKKW